jgi:ribosome biogenesis GTPase A
MVTVHINDKGKQAKALLEMLKTFSFVEIEDKPRYNEETEQAIKDVRAGKTTEFSLEEFKKQLHS